jgi:hypothetical protein
MLVAAFTGIDINIEDVLAIVLPVLAYIFGESWIDRSKKGEK